MTRHTAVRFPPVSGYDIPGLERWLQRMAARGMKFSMTLGPFTLFLPAEPASLRIHLEPARAKIVEDDPGDHRPVRICRVDTSGKLPQKLLCVRHPKAGCTGPHRPPGAELCAPPLFQAEAAGRRRAGPPQFPDPELFLLLPVYGSHLPPLLLGRAFSRRSSSLAPGPAGHGTDRPLLSAGSVLPVEIPAADPARSSHHHCTGQQAGRRALRSCCSPSRAGGGRVYLSLLHPRLFPL